jgi:hypothetical protein
VLLPGANERASWPATWTLPRSLESGEVSDDVRVEVDQLRSHGADGSNDPRGNHQQDQAVFNQILAVFRLCQA